MHEEGHHAGHGDRDAIRDGQPRRYFLIFRGGRRRLAPPEPIAGENRHRDQRAGHAHDEQKLKKIVIAYEQCRGPDQLDIATAEKAAPEEQKSRDKKCRARRQGKQAGAGIAIYRDPKGGEHEDRDDHLIWNAACSDIAVSHDGKDADPDNKNN